MSIHVADFEEWMVSAVRLKKQRLRKKMRESGELHELLRRAVGDGAAEQGLPESYVGFEGCDDF